MNLHLLIKILNVFKSKEIKWKFVDLKTLNYVDKSKLL